MGSHHARLACVAVAAALGFGSLGCQQLYGGKPEKLRPPGTKKKRPDVVEAVVEVKYVEDCTVNFRDEPKNAQRQTGVSNTLVGDGEQAMAQARRETNPANQARLLREAVEKYRNALSKDHYNQEATLKLALAYDLVYRKGCALALLKRIASFQANPKFAKRANQLADEVNDNPQYFKGYRKDAVTAVGR